MNHSTYVGIGINPNGVDLPLGFGMNLMQEPNAMETFGQLTEIQKAKLVDFMQRRETGDEAKNRIKLVIQRLHDNPAEAFE